MRMSNQRRPQQSLRTATVSLRSSHQQDLLPESLYSPVKCGLGSRFGVFVDSTRDIQNQERGQEVCSSTYQFNCICNEERPKLSLFQAPHSSPQAALAKKLNLTIFLCLHFSGLLCSCAQSITPKYCWTLT